MKNSLFKRDFHYSVQLINKYISIIKSSEDQNKISKFKCLIFKMMKDIVNKNIKNYQNLIVNSGLKETIEYEELVSECYIIFENCLLKYDVEKGKNFYFYFNKSLSRNFYRFYQKKIKFPQADVEENYFNNFKDYTIEYNYSIDLVLKKIANFSEKETKVILSKFNGERQKIFLSNNLDINQNFYNKTIDRLKKILKSNNL